MAWPFSVLCFTTSMVSLVDFCWVHRQASIAHMFQRLVPLLIRRIIAFPWKTTGKEILGPEIPKLFPYLWALDFCPCRRDLEYLYSHHDGCLCDYITLFSCHDYTDSLLVGQNVILTWFVYAYMYPIPGTISNYDLYRLSMMLEVLSSFLMEFLCQPAQVNGC